MKDAFVVKWNFQSTLNQNCKQLNSLNIRWIYFVNERGGEGTNIAFTITVHYEVIFSYFSFSGC